MHGRTVLPTDVLKCLPNLKLILTTGLKNAEIGIQTCKELDITVVGVSGEAGPTGLPPKISRQPRWTQPYNTPGL